MLKRALSTKSMLILAVAFFVLLANVSPAVSSASDTQDTIYNVKQHGAVGNGIADDTQAILSAINSASYAGGGTVLFPAGKYRVTSTINVPGFVSVVGVSPNTSVTTSSVSIIGSLSLSPVVRLSGGGGCVSTTLKSLTVTRESGTIPSGVIGVLIESTDYTLMEDVNICRHAIGYQITGQLGFKAQRVTSYAATEAYCVVKDIPEPSFTYCSFGRNGGEQGVGPPASYVEIWGSTDTVSFLGCHFSSTNSSPVENGIYFKSFNNPNGIIYFNSSQMENCNNAVTSDAATPQIQRLLVSNSTFNLGVTRNFINLNAATASLEWCISNNVITGKLNLNNPTAAAISGNRFVGTFSISSGSAAVSGNTFYTGGTISGTFTSFSFTGNVFDGVAQKLTDNASGQKTILGNVSTDGTSNKEVLSNNYLKLGSGVSFGVKRYTGTLNSSGAATISHGITNGHQSGLIIQAWCKGNSGEMVPMTVNYMNSSSIYITGGIASRPYRVLLIYTNEMHTW